MCHVRKSTEDLNVIFSLGHENIVKLLLENGADINYVNEYNGTALAAAIYKGNEKK